MKKTEKTGDKVKKAPEHLRFAVLAADVALFTIHDGKIFVRLIPVNRPPNYVKRLGLPGGLLLPHETAEEAALRLLKTKSHIADEHIWLEQLYTFSRVDRDPRGRVVAVGYFALIPWSALSEREQGESEGSYWSTLSDARNLAYDHDEMLAVALSRLRSRVAYTTLIQKLLPAEFTLTELEEAYEIVTGRTIDKRNFRKKIEKLGILKELARKREGGRHRPARLYCFASSTVKEIEVL
jgi:8-oxo-dGTP diphosphatase